MKFHTAHFAIIKVIAVLCLFIASGVYGVAYSSSVLAAAKTRPLYKKAAIAARETEMRALAEDIQGHSLAELTQKFGLPSGTLRVSKQCYWYFSPANRSIKGMGETFSILEIASDSDGYAAKWHWIMPNVN